MNRINWKKLFWLIFATVFFLLAIYQTLKGLYMLYEPLYYIGLGFVNYFVANTAFNMHSKS